MNVFTRTLAAIATVSVLLVGALVAMPGASAQSVGQPIFGFTLSGAPATPVTPIEQTVTVSVDWTYNLKVPPQNLAGAQGTAQVTVSTICTPGQVTIAGATTSIIAIDTAGTGTTYDGKLPIQVILPRTLPALDPISCTVTGSVSSVFDQGVPESNTHTDTFVIKPDYFALIEAKTDLKLRQGGPQKQIPFAIEVTNFGNGQTKVNFEMVERPSKGNWQGLIPDQLFLDAPGGNKQTNNAVFTVATPYKNGWNNEEGAFTLLLKPEYAFNSEKTGSDVTITLLARVRGVYVPSLEPLVMVGVVIGAAMVARMNREDEA